MSSAPQITVKPEYIDDIIAAIAELWRECQAKQQRLEYRQSLQNQIRATVWTECALSRAKWRLRT